MSDDSSVRSGDTPQRTEAPDGRESTPTSPLRAEWADERHPDWRAGWSMPPEPAPVAESAPTPAPESAPAKPPAARTSPPPTPSPHAEPGTTLPIPGPAPVDAVPPVDASSVVDTEPPAAGVPVDQPPAATAPTGAPSTGNPWLAMLASFARVFLVALGSAAIAVWETEPNHDLSTWTEAKWKAFAGAVLMAALLTAVNALRRGEPRFGLRPSSPRPE